MARILVLDKADVIDRLKAQLGPFGHEVISADTDAYAALAHVSGANAELMIIGLNLPGGGAQLIEKLRSDPATARIPIIALFDDDWSGIEPGALTRLLQKPTDSDTLKLLLDELLPRRPPPKPPAAADDEGSEPPPPAPKDSKPMDMGSPSDEDLPPGEVLEL